MINLLKEKDIERGLTLLEYIDWCKLYNVTKIVNIKSSEECTKKEILNYSHFLNENHKKQMKMSFHNSENDKMLKCMTCKYCKNISKDNLNLSEIQEYTITCTKEIVCFGAKWNAHVSDLPCWKNDLTK